MKFDNLFRFTCLVVCLTLLSGIYSCQAPKKSRQSPSNKTLLSGKSTYTSKAKQKKKPVSVTSSKRRLKDDFNYFQTGTDSTLAVPMVPLPIRIYDLLSINVYSSTLNQEQVSMFNMANGGSSGGGSSTGGNNGASGGGYEVDQDGYIIFPMLGPLKVAGLTRAQLSEYLKKLLSDNGFVKEPNVSVRFSQIHINILGEVKSPGVKTFNTDRITLLDALSSAGDLSENGRRDNIQLVREENGRQKFIPINLMDARFMGGANFQMQQNDLLYVKANDFKLKEKNYDPSFQRDLQRWMTLTSFATIIMNIFFLFIR